MILLPDCIRYYFDKFINDAYLVDKKLESWKILDDDKHQLARYPISDMNLKEIRLFTTRELLGDIMDEF